MKLKIVLPLFALAFYCTFSFAKDTSMLCDILIVKDGNQTNCGSVKITVETETEGVKELAEYRALPNCPDHMVIYEKLPNRSIYLAELEGPVHQDGYPEPLIKNVIGHYSEFNAPVTDIYVQQTDFKKNAKWLRCWVR